ncbi:MAG: PKD domain-containing protein, partial [Chitinophagales bacterium]
ADSASFIYAFPGEDAYPVLMTVYDVNGCIYSATDTIIISGASPSFTIDSIIGCSPFTVYLSDATTYLDAGGIDIVTYEWNFDGGAGCPTYYGITPPPCTYGSGTHTISLTVTDNGGCSFTYAEPISVTGEVMADFIADTLACNSTEPLYFSNTSTGAFTDVLWDFGDGSTSTDITGLHAYATAGTYTVSLTVSDMFGCEDTYTETINVVLDSIYAGFDVSYLTSASCPPIPVELDNTSTGDYISFWWEIERETGTFTYTLDTVILSYTEPGDYDVSIFVIGNTGCIDTLTIPDALDIPGPTGEVLYTPVMACTPADIFFDFSELTADLAYVDFGDGDTLLVTGDMSYTYPSEGEFCPTLILIDATGCSYQINCDTSITIFQTHDIEIAISDTGICLGETVSIYNSSIGSGLNPIEGYLIDFGDGSPPLAYANFDSIVYTYTSVGSYTLTVITMSDVACGDTISYNIEIYSTPTASASLDPATGCFPLDVNFYLDDLAADIALIDFGDGVTDTITGDITYTYNTFGNFDPVLTLINGGVCSE